MNKETLLNSVKEWITLDDKIKDLGKQIKETRIQKKELTEVLLGTMKENEIDCFDISDGKIIHTQNRSRAPLSKQHLLKSLSDYFSDTDIDIESVSKFVLDSRAIKTKDDIRHKPPKNM